MLNYLYITLIIIFIVDISGFIDSIKYLLSKILGFNVTKLKPIDCSLCLTFWSTLIYTILTDLTLFNILLCCVFSYSTTYILELVYLMKDLYIKILRKIK